MNLEGKRIIATGGAKGIGASVVKNYCLKGAKVVSMDVDNENGQLVVDECNRLKEGSAIYLSVDISNKKSVSVY